MNTGNEVKFFKLTDAIAIPKYLSLQPFNINANDFPPPRKVAYKPKKKFSLDSQRATQEVTLISQSSFDFSDGHNLFFPA